MAVVVHVVGQEQVEIFSLPYDSLSMISSRVMSSASEIYQHGHHTSVVSSHAKRTAETDAAFFLPYLKSGMRLLDVRALRWPV
jgi:hypothetical protein